MATASEFSVGLAHKICAAAADAGWSPEEVNSLAQNQTLLKKFREVQLGWAKIQAVKRILCCKEEFDPSLFIGEGWEPEEIDERAVELSELDISQCLFETCLEEGETFIKGEEKFRRLKAASHIRLGGKQFLAFWQDYKARGDDSILEWLRRTKGITSLDFFGLILRNPHGDQCVLYFYWYGSQWSWDYGWLEYVWHVHFLSVVWPAS